MAVRLMFPTYVFHRNMLNAGETRGFSKDYLVLLQTEIDSMRRNDPKGRQISNQYTGWQSNDGCESSPIFQKLMNEIVHTFNDEVLPFNGLNPKTAVVSIGNSWANINDKGAWNSPHGHAGCWYSGVFYIKADGDEGDLLMIDTDEKVLGEFPPSQRTSNNFNFSPTSGELVLFPSGAMHMVEPNQTDKERYSISFNINMNYLQDGANFGHVENYNSGEFVFDLDQNGNPIMN
tara:strand:+ start:137 stop:835 length:699 start_codon:yes stop_codon:yes gene_type:complete